MSVKPPKITPRNTGGAAPPGYLVGRQTRGRQKGPLQFISVQMLAAMGVVTKATLRSLAFLDLSDTPKSYTGSGTKFVQVNGGETALVFTTAVVPTGSPVSGNLTKFSGVSSVTNGDLSGVVTTSGTLTTTAANPFQIGTCYVRTGAGAGAGTDPEGTLYLRTDNGLAYSQFELANAAPTRVQDKVAWSTYTGVLTSSPTPGNYLIAVGFGEASPSVSAGWTSIHSGNDAIAGIGTFYRIVAYHLIQAGDTTSNTPFTGSSPVSVSLHEVSGLDQIVFNNSLASVQGGTSADLGTVSKSFTTTSNNNLAILSAAGVATITQQSTTLGGTTTWNNQSSATGATIGSAVISTSGTAVNGTATFSGGFGDRYTAECMVVLNPQAATQDTGLQQLSYLTVVKNAGSAFTTNPRSLNFSTGTAISDDGVGNYTITASGSGGTVTSIATNNGITGGTITGTGTIGLASVADGSVLANISGGSAAPSANTESAILDHVFSNTRGSILYRGASGWAALGPGTNGYSLTTSGAGADPAWTNVAGGGGGGVTSVAAGDGANFNTITTTGSITVANVQPQGRLSLVSATPVMAGDATAQTTIYYCEYTGNSVPIYNGSNMQPVTFSNVSLILDTSNFLLNNVYDVFAWNNSGTLTLGGGPAWINTATITVTIATPAVVTWTGHGLAEGAPVVFTTTGALPTGITAGTTYFVGRSPATNSFNISTSIANASAGTFVATSGSQSGTHTGTNGTTKRGTGAGTTELVLQNGLWVNKNAITLHNNSVSSGSLTAKTATYLGSFFCTANGQTGIQFKPSPAAGGSANIVGLYNAYSQIVINSVCQDNTATWTYATANVWRPADNNVNNSIRYLDGLGSSQITVVCEAQKDWSGVPTGYTGIGQDSTNTVYGVSAGNFSASGEYGHLTARNLIMPLLGLHTVTQIESQTTSATATWHGKVSDISGVQIQQLLLEMLA